MQVSISLLPRVVWARRLRRLYNYFIYCYFFCFDRDGACTCLRVEAILRLQERIRQEKQKEEEEEAARAVEEKRKLQEVVVGGL
jgi:hypothetical protein